MRIHIRVYRYALICTHAHPHTYTYRSALTAISAYFLAMSRSFLRKKRNDKLVAAYQCVIECGCVFECIV
jgi:hypothetical protein